MMLLSILGQSKPASFDTGWKMSLSLLSELTFELSRGRQPTSLGENLSLWAVCFNSLAQSGQTGSTTAEPEAL